VGRPIGPRRIWEDLRLRAGFVWINMALAGLSAAAGGLLLVVPGIALGCFVAPVFFVEKKQLFDLNTRNLQLFRYDPARVLAVAGATLLAWVAAALFLALLGRLLLWIPVLGGVLSGVLLGVALAAGGALTSITFVHLYLDLRRDHEGGDPTQEAVAALTGAAGAGSLGAGTRSGDDPVYRHSSID
jgi:hypothetical protein